MEKIQCRQCLNRVDPSKVFHVMRLVGGNDERAPGRRKSTICVDCARTVTKEALVSQPSLGGWLVSTLRQELQAFDKKQPSLFEATKEKDEFDVLKSALKAFRVGDRMTDDELRVLAKRFRDAAVALSGIMEYDIARRSAIHDWHRIYDVAKARGVKIAEL